MIFLKTIEDYKFFHKHIVLQPIKPNNISIHIDDDDTNKICNNNSNNINYNYDDDFGDKGNVHRDKWL